MNIKSRVLSITKDISSMFQGRRMDSDEELLLKEVKEALECLKRSELYFQNVTDPDLIDYSIYRMDAALEKYTYLIKLAKARGVKSKWNIMK